MYQTWVPIMLRENEKQNGYVQKALEEIQRCGAEGVLVAPSMSMYQYEVLTPKLVQLLKETIGRIREEGLRVGVWINAFGHQGDSVTSGESKYVHQHFYPSGEVMPYCPLDEKLAEDSCKSIRLIGACNPDLILLDDDYRMSNWASGSGCFCDLHMKRIYEILGEEIDRETFKKLVFSGGKNKYRDAWMQAKGESMIHFSETLRKALDTVNPNVRMGFACGNTSWDGEGSDAVIIAKALAGNTKPFIRTTGAPYHSILNLENVIEEQRAQGFWCRDEQIEVISEGDTYPRPRYATPASFLECYDTILRADGNLDGILKYVLDYCSDAYYETGYVDQMVDNKPLYQELDRYFVKKKAVGVRPFVAPHRICTMEMGEDRQAQMWKVLNCNVDYAAIRFARANLLPTTYEDGNVSIVFGASAWNFPLDQLQYGCILDADAAQILMKRGVDVGAVSFESVFGEKNVTLGAVPVEYYPEEDRYVRMANAPGELAGISASIGTGLQRVEHKEGAQVLSQIHLGDVQVDSAYTYENAQKQRFLVFPFDGTLATEAIGWCNSYSRNRQVAKAVAWLGGKPMPAVVEGNYPKLYVMVKQDAREMSVGIWNLFPDYIDNLKIRLDTDAKKIRFLQTDGVTDGNLVTLTQRLQPFAFAGFTVNI